MDQNNTFQHIYSIVSRIPRGKVMTYGQIALLAYTNPRVVGFAMHGNKDTKKVPCHRVVSKNGSMIGYALGGPNEKMRKLRDEGVKFFEDGKVNLKASLFIAS